MWSQPTADNYIVGYATYYADGVMDSVIEYRGLGHADGVALNSAGDLHRWVWLQWSDGTVDGPLPVVDCAQRIHYITRENQNRVVEVSADLAREREFYGVGPEWVIVWFVEPTLMWE